MATRTVTVPQQTVTRDLTVTVPQSSVTETGVAVTVPEQTIGGVVVPSHTVTVASVPVTVPQHTVAVDGASVTVPAHDVQVTVPDPQTAYPKVASPQQNSGESFADACVRCATYGFNGFVCYQTPGNPTSWSTGLKELATKMGTKEITLQLTCRTHSDSGLQQVLQNLPAAWIKKFRYNHYQEPEDNLAGDAAACKAYRDVYTAAAKVIRAWNSANPGKAVSLPWVEWQEWTTNPNNTKGWNLQDFTPPQADFAGVLWSFFETNERNRVDDQVSRVKAAMAKYAPGKPFEVMAGAYPISTPSSDAQLTAQATWLKDSYYKLKAAGCGGWGWWNFRTDDGRERRVEKNPKLGTPPLASLT